MSGVLFLASQYLWHHKARSLLIIACLTMTAVLPIAMSIVGREFQRSLSHRANSTPLIIGAKGSRYDLALHALYFRHLPNAEISMDDVEDIADGGLAKPIPLHVRFKAQNESLVGTTKDYFEWRQLKPAIGNFPIRFGDCVLGAAAAKRLGLGVDDRLISQPENLFDIAGPAPLNMRVTGILAESQTIDDEVVFVDLETAWIIQGIGHGHQATAPKQDGDEHIIDGQRVAGYTEITDENLESFHFHGDKSKFPITALIALPKDEKSQILLEGQFLDPKQPLQIQIPSETISELLQLLLQVKRLVNATAFVLAAVTTALIVQIVLLTLQLRRQELETLILLGSSRCMIAKLQIAELGIVVFFAILATTAVAVAIDQLANSLILLTLR